MPDHRKLNAKAIVPLQESAKSSSVEETLPARHSNVGLDSEILAKLHNAAIGAERETLQDVIRDALAAGHKPEDLADHYIPELARKMGDMWCGNQISFAVVTIAVSRLQSMLRDLGPSWAGDTSTDPSAPSVMLIVPQDVYHTLGAMVLGSQLRRAGLSVRIMLGVRPDEIATRLRRTTIQAVFVSSSHGETLKSLAKIIDVVKSSVENAPPIVIGGALFGVGC